MATLITIPQNTTYLQNGLSVDTNQVENPLGTGVSQPSLFLYNVIPAAPVVDYIASSQNVSPATPLTLRAVNQTIFLGTPVIVLDCQRSLTLTIAAGATVTNTNVTVEGYDNRDVRVTMTTLLPAGTANSTVDIMTKTITKVISVTMSADPGRAIAVGTGNKIGLPFFVPRAQYILQMYYNNLAISPLPAAAIFVPGYQFNPISGVGAPAAPSATTTDARGFVILPTAADGVKMLTVFGYVYGADSQLQANLTNQSSAVTSGNLTAAPSISAITQTAITTTAQNSGQMLERDEVGLQFPGGS